METRRESVFARSGFRSIYWTCLAALAISFIFGGGSRQWLPSEFVCQVFGVVFLAVAFAQIANCEQARRLWPEIGLAGLILLIPLIQVIPLPPFVWSALPGRSSLVEEFRAAHGSLPWQPISLSAEATWQSIFSLCCPLAVFISSLMLTFEERRKVSLFVLGFGGLSIVLSLLQLIGGPDSGLRFYTITNPDLPVGFFANRNHFAAFLYSQVPLAAAWVVALGLKVLKSQRTQDTDQKQMLAYLVAAGVFASLIFMQGLIHSRAGLLITIVGAVLSFGLALPFRKSKLGAKAMKGMFIALIVAVLLMGYYAIYSIIAQFDHDPVDDARFTIIKGTLKALWAYFPVGSGFGTFDAVYRAFETPGGAIAEYINRAHDDILETLIEGGIFTIVTAALFVAWLVRGTLRVWSARTNGLSVLDASLARAGALVPILLILHCFLDYPLRTVALMSLLAFSCALIVSPIEVPEAAPTHARARRTSRMPSGRMPSSDRSAT